MKNGQRVEANESRSSAPSGARLGAVKAPINPFGREAEFSGIRHWFPGLAILEKYERAWLAKDIIAGVVLSAILIPIGMGYAIASGLAEPVTDIDVTAADMLTELFGELQKAGIELHFAVMKGPVKDLLKHYGLFEQFDEKNFYPTVGQAVDGYLQAFKVDWQDWDEEKG